MANRKGSVFFTRKNSGSVTAGSGVKRKTGMGAGVDSRVARPPEEQHQRRTGSLSEVLTRELVETPNGLKPGEWKMLKDIEKLEYYESLQLPSTRPKSRRKKDSEIPIKEEKPKRQTLK